MKYTKASDVLPEELLNAVQQYAEGSLLYIPNRPETRRLWGSSTDTKAFLKKRNQDIAEDFRSGLSIQEIMDKYHLSESTIRKIVYSDVKK